MKINKINILNALATALILLLTLPYLAVSQGVHVDATSAVHYILSCQKPNGGFGS